SPGQSPYGCTVCRKTFSSRSDLLQHQRSHRAKKRTHQCTECGKSFARVSALTQHRAIHRGERVFECSNCGDRF
ncbi:ZNF22 protein, partial [Pedionomus torquatus]|nr:ZNF22 protein [Pedionomus torquatus]